MNRFIYLTTLKKQVLMKKILFALVLAGLFSSCADKPVEQTLSGLKKADFETTVDGKNTALYVLKNKNGIEVCVTNYGGRIVSVMTPDKNGKMTDVVLGYGKIADYLASNGNFGAFIGRYGNRIANARFTLDGTEYTLVANNGINSLHGGPTGYHTRVLDAKQLSDQAVEFRYLSKDMEEGFPGNLDIKMTYILTDDNALDIQYEATTDKPTVVNLTNHSYFNLSGIAGSQILDHVLAVNADAYTPVNESLITTGELAPVEGTPMDLRRPVAVGAHIDEPFEQLVRGRGYDHNWVLNAGGDVKVLAARASHPGSGIVLEVYTNEPGVQFYAGNAMSGNDRGKHGVLYPHRGAICLETQHYPDSPNKPGFPSAVLRPGEKYFSRCIYKFSVE